MSLLEKFLGMSCVEHHSSYLGLPMLMGRNKRETFKELEERLEKRLHDWKNLMLSNAGREIMVKACLQAIPLYFMSCFKLPKTVCNRMTANSIEFWWNEGKKERKIHWVCND